MLTRDDGFSLLEVLIAFAILALSLGMVFQTFALGTKGSARAEQTELALLLAQSKLKEIGHTIPLEESTLREDNPNDLVTIVTIEPYKDEAEKQDRTVRSNRLFLMRATVTVVLRDQPKRPLASLSTLRVRAK